MGLVFFEPYEYYQVFYVCMFYLLAIHQFLYTPRQWLLAPSVSRFQLDSVYPFMFRQRFCCLVFFSAWIYFSVLI